MLRNVVSGFLLGALFAVPTASAQEQAVGTIQISFTRAVELARRQAPRLHVAHAWAREADSRVEAARVWRTNPGLSGSSGPRFSPTGTSVDASLGLEQPIMFGGGRALRVEVAEAEARSASGRTADIERLLLRDLGIVFAEVLYWKERGRLSAGNLKLAEELERVARRRHEVGDVGGLDESVASLARASAENDVARAHARLFGAEGRLRELLGIGPQTALVVLGELESFGAAYPRSTGAERPDVTRLMAREQAAAASQRLAETRGIPRVTAGLQYSREEQANIFRGVLSVTLPFLDHGQGELAEATAQRVRVQAELSQTAARADVEIATAEKRLTTLERAAAKFTAGGLEALGRAEHVASASYSAGAMDLPELLAVRRELSAARSDFAALLLELAVARVDLIASTSGW